MENKEFICNVFYCILKFLIMKGSFLFLLMWIMLTSGKDCDCYYKGPFIDVSKEVPLVAIVKVKKYLTYSSNMPMSMEVEVVELLKGSERRNNITIWGDNGLLCRPYLSKFGIGECYVLSLYNGNYNGGQLKEKDSDYSISICGSYWLSVDLKKNIAIGNIEGENRGDSSFIDLCELKDRLKKL